MTTTQFLRHNRYFLYLLITMFPIFVQSATLEEQEVTNAAHQAAFAKNNYPSASVCKVCHEKHYREWSVSPHAYAQISPIFQTFQGAVSVLTNGTSNDFCIRCHSPIGIALGEPIFLANKFRAQSAREGITCIVCHRVNEAYGKINGRMQVNPGSIVDAVTGPTGSKNLDAIISDSRTKVVTEASARGRKIHGKIDSFITLTQPQFCGTCHDVTSLTGLRLEEAFSEFKHTSAANRGDTCQDCHMGKIPGVVSGYEFGNAAEVAGFKSPDRKLTNHMFIGPDYSVVHPGIFPHNPEAHELATIDEWLAFDYKKGWGTDEYEDTLPEGTTFPSRWEDIDDRIEAREIISYQLDLLEEANAGRLAILSQGYQIGDIQITRRDNSAFEFAVDVKNGTDGHMVPTGFIAERLVYLEVTVLDKDENVVFISGDVDRNGDVRDLHSVPVHNGEIELDPYLFSLQSKFITRSIRGGEREEVLPVNFSIDPLPFMRPYRSSSVLSGRPRGARIHKKSIPPLATRVAKYKVDRNNLPKNGPYKIRVKLFAQMLPVNLIHAIQVLEFDYNMSAQEVADAVRNGKQLLGEKTVDLGN